MNLLKISIQWFFTVLMLWLSFVGSLLPLLLCKDPPILLVDATSIKWTPNKDNVDNPAATAPRSQKYWDEHGIERPDYAKTDEEIALEKKMARSDGGEDDIDGWRLSLFGRKLFLPILWIAALFLLRFLYVMRFGRGGHRLGIFLSSIDAEEARRARLAKFQTNADNVDGKHE